MVGKQKAETPNYRTELGGIVTIPPSENNCDYAFAAIFRRAIPAKPMRPLPNR